MHKNYRNNICLLIPLSDRGNEHLSLFALNSFICEIIGCRSGRMRFRTKNSIVTLLISGLEIVSWGSPEENISLEGYSVTAIIKGP